jgi:hypothetical protein
MTGFDARKFERNLKKAVEKAANLGGCGRSATDLQSAFDAVYRTHNGSPSPRAGRRSERR